MILLSFLVSYLFMNLIGIIFLIIGFLAMPIFESYKETAIYPFKKMWNYFEFYNINLIGKLIPIILIILLFLGAFVFVYIIMLFSYLLSLMGTMYIYLFQKKKKEGE